MDKLDANDVGDLGLGDGLRPGSLPQAVCSTHGLKWRESREDSYSDSDVASAADVTSKTSRFLQRIRRRHKSPRARAFRKKDDQQDSASDRLVEDLTDLALCSDFAAGSSIRQQKSLFERDIKELLLNDVTTIKEFKDENGKSKITELDNDAVQKKLQQTQEEVEILKQELEQCQKQLDAKYKAIKILQGQGSGDGDGKTAALHRRDVTERKHVVNVNRELQKQINSVQFELEYRQSCLLSSQELWAERFDSACQESVRLAQALEQTSSDMKKLHAEKMALSRERDELLALVDVQERQRFESLKGSQSSQDSSVYNNFSSMELAVLGACQCRGVGDSPCGCAHAAAALQRRVVGLQQRLSEQTKKVEESAVVTDAYRVAFEEQLGRNRELIRRLGDLALTPVQMSKTDKAKAAVKWLIKQLNEDESILPPIHRRKHGSRVVTSSAPGSLDDTTSNPTLQQAFTSDMEQLFAEVPESQENGGNLSQQLVNGVDLDKSTEEQLIEMLAEMVSDKSEALLHSRLTAKMLAKRNRDLEQQLKASREQADEVFKASREQADEVFKASREQADEVFKASREQADEVFKASREQADEMFKTS